MLQTTYAPVRKLATQKYNSTTPHNLLLLSFSFLEEPQVQNFKATLLSPTWTR
jgi:hypothetical protein